jgi:hypothetical protein
MRVKFLVALVMTGTLSAATALSQDIGAPQGEQAVRDSIKENGKRLLLSGDTDGFDELANRYRSTRERSPAGIWKLSLLYNCVTSLGIIDPLDSQWERLEAMADRWLAEKPTSVAAVVIAARLRVQHAWAYRGDGYAGSVKSNAWGPYGGLVESARAVLDAHTDIQTQDPEWDAVRIAIASQQGASRSSILAMAEQALRREPYYYSIHYAAADALSPKWGGTEEMVKQYVAMAVERSRAKEGTQAYERIYFYILRFAPDANPLHVLNATGAEWPPLQQSIVDVLKAYPDPYNFNAALSFYCFGDAATFYKSLGKRWQPSAPLAWWDAPAWREGCDKWAYEGVVAHKPIAERVTDYLSFLAGVGAPFWQTVALVAFLTWGGMELFLSRVRPGPKSRSSHAQLALAASNTLDPSAYPRGYRVLPPPQGTAIAVGMLILGTAIAWQLCTIPWGYPAETLGVVIACCIFAIGGALALVRRVRSKVVLQPDAIEVTGLFDTVIVRRSEIAACRRPGGNVEPQFIDLIVTPGLGKNRRIPPVLGIDEPYRSWFATLPHEVASR